MKMLVALITLVSIIDCQGQVVKQGHFLADLKKDSSLPKMIFVENFDNNVNNWTVGDHKQISARIDSGFYYLTSLGHAYGEGQELKIDTRKDFQVESRIKILKSNSEHKNYYSMLFWGRTVTHGYFFTFAKDGFSSVEVCDGKKQSDCDIKPGSFQKTKLEPEDFNVYIIKKIKNRYYFYINGEEVYTMPFAPFFGNFVGFGAGRKATLMVDYLKILYL